MAILIRWVSRGFAGLMIAATCIAAGAETACERKRSFDLSSASTETRLLLRNGCPLSGHQEAWVVPLVVFVATTVATAVLTKTTDISIDSLVQKLRRELDADQVSTLSASAVGSLFKVLASNVRQSTNCLILAVGEFGGPFDPVRFDDDPHWAPPNTKNFACRAGMSGLPDLYVEMRLVPYDQNHPGLLQLAPSLAYRSASGGSDMTPDEEDLLVVVEVAPVPKVGVERAWTDLLSVEFRQIARGQSTQTFTVLEPGPVRFPVSVEDLSDMEDGQALEPLSFRAFAARTPTGDESGKRLRDALKQQLK